MFWQGPHLVKYASKEIYKIRKNGDISIFAFPLATVITFCHTVACNFLYLWPSTCQVSLCLYKNIVNEIKPSHLKNCLVLVDIKNTIGCLEKKIKMIIKIILFFKRLLFIIIYSPDTLFKTLKGEMVTTLNQRHIPI